MMEERDGAKGGLELLGKAMEAIRLDLAKKSKRIQQLEEQIALTDLLKQVNTYMGSILDFEKMLEMIDDVLTGVMGVSACGILVEIGEERYIKENVMNQSLQGKFSMSFFDLVSRVMGVTNTSFLVNNLERQGIGEFRKGSLLVFSIRRGPERYGHIAVYYEQPGMMTKQREEFFSLVAGQLGVFFENARLYTQMKEYAITDGLTTLRNRSYLDRLIQEGEFNKGKAVGAFFLDIDNFKKVNDTHGHPVGDEVLRVIGRIVMEDVRQLGGRSFRYGGEEIIATFIDKDPVAITRCAKSVLARMKSEVFVTESGAKFQITASFGVCTESGGVNMLEVIRRADRALYEAKHTGKNRVVAFRDPVFSDVEMSVQ